jgi:hypothetical protein
MRVFGRLIKPCFAIGIGIFGASPALAQGIESNTGTTIPTCICPGGESGMLSQPAIPGQSPVTQQPGLGSTGTVSPPLVPQQPGTVGISPGATPGANPGSTGTMPGAPSSP